MKFGGDARLHRDGDHATLRRTILTGTARGPETADQRPAGAPVLLDTAAANGAGTPALLRRRNAPLGTGQRGHHPVVGTLPANPPRPWRAPEFQPGHGQPRADRARPQPAAARNRCRRAEPVAKHAGGHRLHRDPDRPARCGRARRVGRRTRGRVPAAAGAPRRRESGGRQHRHQCAGRDGAHRPGQHRAGRRTLLRRGAGHALRGGADPRRPRPHRRCARRVERIEALRLRRCGGGRHVRHVDREPAAAGPVQRAHRGAFADGARAARHADGRAGRHRRRWRRRLGQPCCCAPARLARPGRGAACVRGLRLGARPPDGADAPARRDAAPPAQRFEPVDARALPVVRG